MEYVGFFMWHHLGAGRFSLKLNKTVLHSCCDTISNSLQVHNSFGLRCSSYLGATFHASRSQSISLKYFRALLLPPNIGQVPNISSVLKARSKDIGCSFPIPKLLKPRHKKGFFCASFDRDYDKKSMDFCGNAGFL